MLKSKSVVLVDVRNRTEFNRVGKIPGSFILPLHEVEAAFDLSPEKFLEKYEFEKPETDALVMMTKRFLDQNLLIIRNTIFLIIIFYTF